MAKKKPKKVKAKSKLLLVSDLDGHSAIISSLKRSFSRSPTVVSFLKKHRREEIWFKKDGTKAAKPHVFYKCSECTNEFNSANIQVDHIEPVVPLNIPSRHLSYDTFIERLHCDESGLQILCKNDHAKKSLQENAIRKEWLVKTKYIVYQTTNRINNKKYIGVHKCDDYDDYYLGSGIALKAAIDKYGKDAFYRHILFVYDNHIDAYNKEIELVTAELVKDDNYYNVSVGGKGGFLNFDNESTKIKVICYETGLTYESISDTANAHSISISSISKCLNNPNSTANNLHFFTVEAYSKDITVTYPSPSKSLVHLNSYKIFSSIEIAAKELDLNYKSLRNSLINKTEQGYYSLHDNCFLYADEFDPSNEYKLNVDRIRCIELNKDFATVLEAAIFLKHKNPNHGAIAINRAIRDKVKMYKFHWERITSTVSLPLIK